MYNTAALYYEKSLLIRIQNLSIVVRYWEDMLTLFFCILQNQGKELFMFVLEGLSVQIFFTGSLFPYQLLSFLCTLDNSCTNVVLMPKCYFFENVSFWWHSWWNCIICSSTCTRHAMSFFYLHIIPSLWCISSHTNQYIKIRHTHSMRIDYGVKKSMLGVNRNDDLLWYLGKLFQLLRNVWLAGDKIDLE